MTSPLLKSVREAPWLDGARARAWRNILLGMTGLIALAWLALSRGGLDVTGKPLGTDFLSFYAAGELALSAPARVYEIAAHHAAEAAVFGRDVGYAAFFYPPLFLLLCAPLAVLPYFAALGVWLAATGAAFAAVLRRWLDPRLGWATALAFPAVLITAGHGQNAFLTAALLGVGTLWLGPRPLLAGVAFGLLTIKPHLGLLLPIALLVAGRWRTIAAAVATTLGLAALSVAVFGVETWQGFLVNSTLARATLEHGLVEPGKMVSLFAAVRVLGGSLGLAYAAQLAMAFAAAAALVVAVRRWAGTPAEAPLIILAALAASPFLLDYDLAALAFPLAWLAGEGLRDGFRPWEKTALLAAYCLPLIARPLAMQLHAPLTPLVLAALFVLTWRRAAEADTARLSGRVPSSPCRDLPGSAGTSGRRPAGA